MAVANPWVETTARWPEPQRWHPERRPGGDPPPGLWSSVLHMQPHVSRGRAAVRMHLHAKLESELSADVWLRALGGARCSDALVSSARAGRKDDCRPTSGRASGGGVRCAGHHGESLPGQPAHPRRTSGKETETLGSSSPSLLTQRELPDLPRCAAHAQFSMQRACRMAAPRTPYPPRAPARRPARSGASRSRTRPNPSVYSARVLRRLVKSRRHSTLIRPNPAPAGESGGR